VSQGSSDEKRKCNYPRYMRRTLLVGAYIVWEDDDGGMIDDVRNWDVDVSDDRKAMVSFCWPALRKKSAFTPRGECLQGNPFVNPHEGCTRGLLISD
jgi:hypothetical protein